MAQAGIVVPREIPQEVLDRLFDTMRKKLPSEVSDDVIRDIMAVNLQIVRGYLESVAGQRRKR